MKVYSLEYKDVHGEVVQKNLEDILEWLKTELPDIDPGAEIIVRVKEMEESEYNNLEEWMGP